jgi:hypothetical protein
MSQVSILGNTIEFVRGVNLTPVITLYFALGFILFLTIYHWSGAAEWAENLTGGKKFMVFVLVALFFAVAYYIFYKAGKFDAILNYSVVKDAIKSINMKY